MKKYILIGLIATLASLSAYSQYRFGVRIDPQINFMRSDVKSIKSDGSKLGINIGLVVDKFFAKNYAITSGVSINNLGGKIKYENNEGLKGASGDIAIAANETAEYRLQYITVPLGLKLHTNEIGYLKYYAELGFDGHINIKSRFDSGDTSNESISDSVRPFNLGYFIGGGAQYSLGGNAAVFVGLAYHQGFLDVIEEKVKDNKTMLGTVSIRLGVMF